MKDTNIRRVYLLSLFLSHVIASNTQFAPVMRSVNKSNPCEGPTKSALVENFFNVIFTEFHDGPPTCVCVQMCPNEPTYCYPNGCLKKVENKKKSPDEIMRPTPTMRAQNIAASNTMFLVDDKNDFTHMINDFTQITDQNADSGKTDTLISPVLKDMRPDPFKDRYKMIFKYKKMPKVELRYNLREQVMNMKSDILKFETKDVSKSRWPNNNHLTSNNKLMYKTDEKRSNRMATDSDAKTTKAYDYKAESITSRYFKRDLRRNLKDGVEDREDNGIEKSDALDTKNFSIETLLENLIGNNHEGKRDTDGGPATVIVNDSKDNHSNEVETSTGRILSPNISKDKGQDNDRTCVVSMNMTNQNFDKNKYFDDNPIVKERMNKWQNYTFSQMIASLSKRIEKQNNTSMEILKQSSTNNADVSSNHTKKSLTVEVNLKTVENSSLHNSLTDDIQTVIITKKAETEKLSRESNRKKVL